MRIHFEILCARPPMDRTLNNEEVNLATWAKSHCKNKTIHTLIDPNLKGQIAPECFNKFVEIAELCVRDRGSERPPMGDVVWGLEFALKLQEIAEKNGPSYSTTSDFDSKALIDRRTTVNSNSSDRF
ncbi:unnamed protein product [Amaranthus hypochondriacus]